jgi:hypothetical protein
MSVIKFVVLLQDGCLVRSRNYLPFTIPYVHYLSFMRRVLIIKTSATRRAETAHRSGAPEFTRCLWSFCCVICGFCVVFCRLMFVRLSFFHLAIVLSIIFRPTASDYHKVSSISSNRDTQWINTRLW